MKPEKLKFPKSWEKLPPKLRHDVENLCYVKALLSVWRNGGNLVVDGMVMNKAGLYKPVAKAKNHS